MTELAASHLHRLSRLVPVRVPVVLRDLDNDGAIDGVVSNKNSNSITILKNAAGILILDTTYVISGTTAPNDIAVFDFDNSGLPMSRLHVVARIILQYFSMLLGQSHRSLLHWITAHPCWSFCNGSLWKWFWCWWRHWPGYGKPNSKH